MSRRRVYRSVGAGLLSVAALLMAVNPVAARPMNWGEGEPTKRWPNDTRINIYIPEHPTDANANDDVREGINRWAPKMAPYGITFTFTMAAPPDPLPANSVVVSWPDSVPGDDEGHGSAEGQEGSSNIHGGTIEIEKDNTSGAFLKNLAMHEFGHVLGLADDATVDGEPHNCMDHTVPSTGEMGFTDRDNAEIASLYGDPSTGDNSQGSIDGNSQHLGGDNWRYAYVVQWAGGPEIPIFEVTLGCHPSEVSVLQMPPGWQLHYPPTFLDGIPVPTPTADTRKLHFYAQGSQAALDGSNPLAMFVIVAPHPPGSGLAHAMIEGGPSQMWTRFAVPVPQEIGPGVIPTVSEWGMIVLALLIGVGATVVLRSRTRAGGREARRAG